MIVIKVSLLLSFFCTLVACCGKVKVRKEALFLHTFIATDGEMRVESRDGSTFLADQVPVGATNLPHLENYFSDPALGYLCRCAFQIRTTLYNTGDFNSYLNVVKNAWHLKGFVDKKKNMDLIEKVDSDSFVLFLQDALLLISVTEHVTNMTSDQRCDILTHVLSVTSNYMWANVQKILPNFAFVNFANFVETMQHPKPIKYSPHYSLVGRINADRFVRLMETYQRGVYDLSDVLNYIVSDEIPRKFVRKLKLDNSVQFYLKNRIEEVPLLEHLTSGRHGFGYFLEKATGAHGFSTLLALEQVTYQIKSLFRTTPHTLLLNEPILEGYSRLRSSELTEYNLSWLDIWKSAFSCGLTEVVDFQVGPKTLSTICEKLRLLKLYCRNNEKRMTDVLELERKLEKHITTFKLF